VILQSLPIHKTDNDAPDMSDEPQRRTSASARS
jgi:hypothetical protein